MFITGGPGNKLCAGGKGEIKEERSRRRRRRRTRRRRRKEEEGLFKADAVDMC